MEANDIKFPEELGPDVWKFLKETDEYFADCGLKPEALCRLLIYYVYVVSASGLLEQEDLSGLRDWVDLLEKMVGSGFHHTGKSNVA